MRIRRQHSSSRVPAPVKILISLTIIVGTSFSLAWVWHTTQQTVAAESGQLPPAAAEAAAAPMEMLFEAEESSMPTASLPEVSEVSDKQGRADVEDVSSASEPEPAQATSESTVAESDPVDQSYFDDAIFFGDSISTGIPLYHVADNAAVVAMTGINTDNVNYKEAIDVGGESRVTFIEAAKQYGERGKVYIMLGGNGTGYDIETFIKGYQTFLGSVKELYPNAVIYLQSIPPVTADYTNEFDPELGNDKINGINKEIKELARRENVYYLDVGSALKDESGALPKEASPLDGMHFSPEYYVKWFDYLKTHTVEDKA